MANTPLNTTDNDANLQGFDGLLSRSTIDHNDGQSGDPNDDWSKWHELEQALSFEAAQLKVRKDTLEDLGVDVSGLPLGVCFSGGGIRAANLDLGMLWRLAENNLLTAVTHISAVSGGTYTSSAFASDIVAKWPTVPREGEDIHDGYRKVIADTILRFQENANYPLMPFKCIQCFGSLILQRIIGISCFALLIIFMIILHPVTLLVFFCMPLTQYLVVFHAAWLRFGMCTPPFECKGGECNDTSLIDPWLTALQVGYQESLTWMVLIISIAVGLLRMFGCFKVRPNSNETSSSCKLAVSCWNAAVHFVHGLDMMMRRLLLITLLTWLLMFVASLTQVIQYGPAQIGQVATKYGSQPNASFIWMLPLDLSTAQFPLSLESQDEDVKRVGTWYSCYNYTMSHWQNKGWLRNVSNGESYPIPKTSHADDQEVCADNVVRHGREEDDIKFGHGTGRPFWSFPAFGVFYWGNAQGRPGGGTDGVGPLDETRRAFYQRWYDYCSDNHQAMCYTREDWKPLPGCCSISISYGLCIVFLVLLGLGFGIYLIIGTSVALQLILMSAGPVFAICTMGFLLQWRVFGPITMAAHSNSEGQRMLGIPFSYRSWQILFWAATVFACVFLPFFEGFQRIAHLYYRKCLQHAYFYGGKDVLLADCCKSTLCPQLVFGSTILMYKKDFDDKSQGLFSLSSYFAGSPKSGYIRIPSRFGVARAMSCSGAALETAIMTNLDSWATRFWLIALNLSQGDWLRFGANDRKSCFSFSSQMSPNCQRMWDHLPSLLLLTLVYIFVGLSEILETPCSLAPAFMIISMLIMFVMFSAAFFGHNCLKVLQVLQSSPIVRMMQMLLVATPVTPDKPPPYVYLGDGGLLENSGALELLRRGLLLILVMEAGDDPEMEMIVLKQLVQRARDEKICSFYVLDDHIMSVEERIWRHREDDTETFLHLGILYGWGSDFDTVERKTGHLIWVQNRPTGPKDWTKQPQCQRFVPGAEDAPGTNSTEKPLSELSSCCWDGGCCFPCGTFPNIGTAQQFFSPKMSANFIKFGYLLSQEAIERVIEIRMRHRA